MSAELSPELVAFGETIAAYAKPRASARLRAELRRSLMNAPTPKTRFVIAIPAMRFRAFAATALALLVLAATATSAAAASLPGDPAFALKRGLETIDAALASDDVARLQILLAQADRRLSDLHAVVATRPTATEAAINEYALAVARIEAAIASLGTQPSSARADAAIALAEATSASHVQVLTQLAARLPAAAQPGIQRAIDAHGSLPDHSPSRGGRPSTAPTPRR